LFETIVAMAGTLSDGSLSKAGKLEALKMTLPDAFRPFIWNLPSGSGLV